MEENYNPVVNNNSITLHEPEDISNGLNLNDYYLPEDTVTHMLSFLDAKELLHCSRVCIKWYEIIKSSSLWRLKYKRQSNKKAKNLPWYVYYSYFATEYWDKNLIQNPNGEKEFEHWNIQQNGGNKWIVESPPAGAKPLPVEPELDGHCFATSYRSCSKWQKVIFSNNNLLCAILDKYKPEIYLSEWFTGRFDCGCKYNFHPKLMGDFNKVLQQRNIEKTLSDFVYPIWEKVEVIFKDYPDGVKCVHFYHSGVDTQYWAGHYGSKMAGSVCKLIFESIDCKI